jgi:hypothetical protein
MMTTTWSRFRFSRSQSPRALPQAVALIRTEYERAILAARHYDRLKNRDRAEPRRQRMGAGGVPRAVFEAVYGE